MLVFVERRLLSLHVMLASQSKSCCLEKRVKKAAKKEVKLEKK